MIELKVENIEPVTERINLFTLVSTSGEPLPAYEAGAHIDFDLGDVGTRSYSLIDFQPPTDEIKNYQIAVQREDDGHTAVITGGSKGIGRDLAERLLDKGYTVISIARGIADDAPPN